MILHIYTIIHTFISLIAIFTGFIVSFAMLLGIMRLIRGFVSA